MASGQPYPWCGDIGHAEHIQVLAATTGTVASNDHGRKHGEDF